jgi:hypothetical protein
MKMMTNLPEQPVFRSGIPAGLTVRDYFAYRVATEVPDWFVHEPAPGRPGRLPTFYEDIEPPPNAPLGEIESAAAYHAWAERQDKWQTESGGQLQDAHESAMADWNQRNKLARLAQWRYAVADAMLKERDRDRA